MAKCGRVRPNAAPSFDKSLPTQTKCGRQLREFGPSRPKCGARRRALAEFGPMLGPQGNVPTTCSATLRRLRSSPQSPWVASTGLRRATLRRKLSGKWFSMPKVGLFGDAVITTPGSMRCHCPGAEAPRSLAPPEARRQSVCCGKPHHETPACPAERCRGLWVRLGVFGG